MSDTSSRAAPVRRYVFRDAHRPSRAWMTAFEMINERFSQYLRTALLQLLRPELEVTPRPIELIRHGELIERFAGPSHLTLASLKPLSGRILIAVDAQLVSSIVESRFGGDGRFPLAVGDRELSPFEQKSARRVVQTVLDQLVLAWQPIGRLEPEILRHEMDPQLAGITSSGELIIFSAFAVRLGRSGGKLTICIPHRMLEPLHDKLVGTVVEETIDFDPQWQKLLVIGVGGATIALSVELANISVTVRDLLELRPGSLFEIDRPERVTVEANGSPLFRGRWGKHGRRIGVEIEERLLSTVGTLAPPRREGLPSDDQQ